jgi:SAM-dependent methyltransferase
MRKELDSLFHFNQDNRDDWVAKIARRLPPATRLLDVGAGEGRYRPLFTHCNYVAQDFGRYEGVTEGHLREDWDYTHLDYECDATNIPVPDETFDAVLWTEVLEHVPEPILVLKEISRILRLGGKAFISAPLGSGLHQQPYHFYGGFTPHFYRRFLADVGFQIISIESNGCFFRLLLQEIHRGVNIVTSHKRYPRWNPVRLALKFMVSRPILKRLSNLDDEIQVDEFTVGYHVEAIKT